MSAEPTHAELDALAAADENEVSSLTSLTSRPPVLGDAARIGLAGEFLRLIADQSEADPAALLFSLLVGFGNAAGRSAYVPVEGDQHHTNLSAVVVGQSSKARKGTSWGRVRQMLTEADPYWSTERTMSGLSSGEGVLYQVRNGSSDDDTDDTDQGVTDKRLMIIESEYAQVLRVMRREGNTLSPILRNLWDRGDVGTLTKNAPTRTTGAHVSILGHITRDELRRELTGTDTSNGFGNRILYVYSSRARRLPFGGDIDPQEITSFANLLAAALSDARRRERVTWTPAGRDAWIAAYDGPLAVERPGLVGDLTSRSEAQTLRLALVYMLLDGDDRIGAEHVAAALTCWQYSVASCLHIFGDATGDRTADRIATALREAAPNRVTREHLMVNTFSRHLSRDDLDNAIGVLIDLGHIDQQEEPTGGRPRTTYGLLPRDLSEVSAGSSVAISRDRLQQEQHLQAEEDALRSTREQCACMFSEGPQITASGWHECSKCNGIFWQESGVAA